MLTQRPKYIRQFQQPGGYYNPCSGCKFRNKGNFSGPVILTSNNQSNAWSTEATSPYASQPRGESRSRSMETVYRLVQWSLCVSLAILGKLSVIAFLHRCLWGGVWCLFGKRMVLAWVVHLTSPSSHHHQRTLPNHTGIRSLGRYTTKPLCAIS